MLLAAAHADRHVEPEEMERIEGILAEILGQGASNADLVGKVTSDPGDLAPADVERIGGMLRGMATDGELPPQLVQYLADFDPDRFDMDRAVGPFLREPVEFKRRLLEFAVAVHESDGELDFAEDTFVRELAFKLGVPEDAYADLLLHESFTGTIKPAPDDEEDSEYSPVGSFGDDGNAGITPGWETSGFPKANGQGEEPSTPSTLRLEREPDEPLQVTVTPDETDVDPDTHGTIVLPRPDLPPPAPEESQGLDRTAETVAVSRSEMRELAKQDAERSTPKPTPEPEWTYASDLGEEPTVEDASEAEAPSASLSDLRDLAPPPPPKVAKGAEAPLEKKATKKKTAKKKAARKKTAKKKTAKRKTSKKKAAKKSGKKSSAVSG